MQDRLTDKQYRIYRALNSNKHQSLNTYLQYFDTLEAAEIAASKKDRWNCVAVQIEENIDGKWIGCKNG